MPPNSEHIVIAGLGLISPLGLGAWPTFTALLAGRTIGDRAGALNEGLDAVTFCQSLGRVTVTPHAADDPAVELAERAAREAAAEAGVSLEEMHCYLGTSKGAVHALTRAIDDPTWARAVTLGPHGYLTTQLRGRLHLGLTQHIVAACASSLTALHQARCQMLQPTGPDTVLVLTAEAALLPLFIHSYRRLGVLAPLTAIGYRTGPLDQNRAGFLLSELGAAVILKRTDAPKPGEIELLDTAIAADGFNIMRPAPNMPALQHIARPLLRNRPNIIIHPHATGTQDHDPAELRVYQSLLKPQASSLTPSFYANKGALGHGLGAAGLVSLVLACLCARTNRLPPMPWLKNPISPHLTPQASSLKPSPPHAIFAAGFAGHAAGAVIQKRA